MARESKLDIYALGCPYDQFMEKVKAFEALVRADEREAFAKIQFESLLQAIRIEREACAKDFEAEADTWAAWPQAGAAKRIGAAAIRARGNT
jgi:hypothetical protein